jgi:hypothetical protein
MSIGLRSAVALILLAAPVGVRSVDDGTDLVVHEWGTFTSVVGDDGVPVPWRPLSVSDDLPGFVYRVPSPGVPALQEAGRSLKALLPAIARLETPVLYFYAAQPMSVSARVSFRGGSITEWYPRAERTEEGVRWDPVELLPSGSGAFRDDGSGSHYYAARETDAAALRVSHEAELQEEGFLFYRGVGSLALSLRAVLDRGRLRLEPLGEDVREVLLFSNRGGRIRYSVVRPGGRSLSLEPGPGGQDVPAFQGELRQMLVRHGLYPKEAAAMVATWGDSWFESGTRLFYVLPRPLVDRALPLVVTPRPSQTIRVLVGRLEVILPEDVDRVRAELDRLSDASTVEERDDARRRLGRFGEPTLRRVAARRPDTATRRKIEALLAAPQQGIKQPSRSATAWLSVVG